MVRSLETERISLLRGGSLVSSLAGAFGSSLRETRLTAMLGYLIALVPGRFCDIFGFPGRPLSVALEMRDGANRSDIVVETTKGTGLIEAKIDASDPISQSLRYRANWRVLLTEYAASGAQKRRRGVKYLRWRDLEDLLGQLTKSKRNSIRFVSGDLLRYLEKHNMIKAKQSAEIYAREINNSDTLRLFLKGQMYCCDYEQTSRLAEALYFAPHFGQTLARECLGVQVGISYIARIERVEVVEQWADLKEAVAAVRGKHELKAKKQVLLPLRQNWGSETSKRSVLFLSTPKLVFNPPIFKNKLQKGSGWLSKRVFSFEEFFEAWSASRGPS